jgi:N-acetylglutamate synthase-like GNAT family acetyltransferase
VFAIRKAEPRDVPEIERVMRESITGISSRSYDAKQVESSLQFIAHLDRDLVNDGTYFVVENDGQIVGCGGWSRRARLYAGSGSASGDARMLDPKTEAARIRAMFVAPGFERRGIGRMILDRCESDARAAGFRRLELMAMLSGEAMYAACGYRAVENVPAKLEDGTPFPLTRMEKAV